MPRETSWGSWKKNCGKHFLQGLGRLGESAIKRDAFLATRNLVPGAVSRFCKPFILPLRSRRCFYSATAIFRAIYHVAKWKADGWMMIRSMLFRRERERWVWHISHYVTHTFAHIKRTILNFLRLFPLEKRVVHSTNSFGKAIFVCLRFGNASYHWPFPWFGNTRPEFSRLFLFGVCRWAAITGRNSLIVFFFVSLSS